MLPILIKKSLKHKKDLAARENGTSDIIIERSHGVEVKVPNAILKQEFC